MELDAEDIQVAVEAQENFAAAGDSAMVVALSTDLDDELRDEGFYRELLHRIQNLRKEIDIEYTRRIELSVGGSDRTARVVSAHREHLMAETLCTKLHDPGVPAADSVEREFAIDGERIRVALRPV